MQKNSCECQTMRRLGSNTTHVVQKTYTLSFFMRSHQETVFIPITLYALLQQPQSK